MTQIKPYRTPLQIGDALAYGRQDMDRVVREILVTEGINIANPIRSRGM